MPVLPFNPPWAIDPTVKATERRGGIEVCFWFEGDSGTASIGLSGALLHHLAGRIKALTAMYLSPNLWFEVQLHLHHLRSWLKRGCQGPATELRTPAC